VASIVDWRKVVSIPNGVDVERFFPGPKDVALVERYSLAGKTVVLFVGNLQPFKGLPVLVSSIAKIDDPRIVLLIVGGGYDELAVRSQVNELNLQERVLFAGPQSPSDALPAHYRLGDFLVLPSTHSESFGLVVLEAMATGIPAIVSSLPGPAQLVQEGVDGLIARVGDVEELREKIDFLAREPEKRREMGSAARAKVVRDFGWERVGERLESVLIKIAK
jgi:glycosyltransferase involved in cell wall biosynthesis